MLKQNTHCNIILVNTDTLMTFLIKEKLRIRLELGNIEKKNLYPRTLNLRDEHCGVRVSSRQHTYIHMDNTIIHTSSMLTMNNSSF